MFAKCTQLKKAPIFYGDSCDDCVTGFETTFIDCNEKVQKAGVWNLQHPGKSYYKDR